MKSMRGEGHPTKNSYLNFNKNKKKWKWWTQKNDLQVKD